MINRFIYNENKVFIPFFLKGVVWHWTFFIAALVHPEHNTHNINYDDMQKVNVIPS